MGHLHSPKTDGDHLIKDLGCYCSKTFETAKGKKEGGTTGNRTQGLWLKLPVLCHLAMTPTDTHSSFFPFYYSAFKWLLMRWTGLPHSPKTDGDHLSKIIWALLSKDLWSGKGKERKVVSQGVDHLSTTELTTFLSFSLPFQMSSDSNGPDYHWLDDLH